VNGFLRVVGVLNASIWLGASVFFTFFVGPAFFSEAMITLLSRPYAGAAAQIVLERYYTLHLVCGLIAFGHLVAESLYLGRPLLRWSLSLLAAILVLGFVGSMGIQPRLQRWHRVMVTASVPEEERAAAQRSFRIWHGASQALNLLAMAGVTVYLLRITRQGDNSRYRG
jgi:hypothetical protein